MSQIIEGGSAGQMPAFDEPLNIKIDNFFWTVSQNGITKAQKISNNNLKFYKLDDGYAPEMKHNLKMLFLRKKGEHFYVDGKGKLQRTWFCRSTEKVSQVVNQTLALLLHKADMVQKNAGLRFTKETLLTRAKKLAENEGLEDLLKAGDDLDEIYEAARALSNKFNRELNEKFNKALLSQLNILRMNHADAKRLSEQFKSDEALATALNALCLQYEDARHLSEQFQKKKELVSQLNALCTHIAKVDDEEELVDYQKLSHFLFCFMNREGTIGRMSDRVGYIGPRKDRLFNIDLMQKHVDIVIGNQYWSVNTVTKKVSKALPLKERHDQVEKIYLPGDEITNQNLQKLFERKKGALFFAKEHKLCDLGSFRKRVSYCLNRANEEKDVQRVVNQALVHLESAVKPFDNQGLSIFLRDKFQSRGPLARMKKTVFDRASIISEGEIEKRLKHDLDQAREHLNDKLLLLKEHSLIKKRWENVVDENPLLTESVALALMNDNKLYISIRDQIRNQLKEQAHGELDEYLYQMSEVATRQWIRAIAREKKEIEAAKQKLQQAVFDGQGIIDLARSEKIRHEVKEALHQFLIQEFLFTRSLGIDLERVSCGGSGGARYAFDRKGRKILVVKPDDEGPYGRNNPSWTAYIKQFFLKIRSCLAENSEPVAEVSSCHIDRIFGINIVPSTTINLVNSGDFVGKRWKRCSVQAFIPGCESMQDRLKLHGDKKSSWFRQLFDKYAWKIRESFYSRERLAECFETGYLKDNLEAAINGYGNEFNRALARLIIHNILIQDTDGHFDNWLIKVAKIEDERLKKLLRGEEVDTREIVSEMVEKGLYYELHDALLHDENGFMIIKHDGGSSMPRSHPTTSFETRLAYLFEVLPQMKEVFSQEIKAHFQDADRNLYEAILTVAIQNLVDVSSAKDFHVFWKNPENRKTFKKWLFVGDVDDEEEMRTAIASAFAHNYKGRNREWFHWHYDSHLKRIKGISRTFKERWVILVAHLLEKPTEAPHVLEEEAKAVSDKSMRALFKVKNHKDFKAFRNGHKTNKSYNVRKDFLDDQILAWTREEVPEIDRKEDYAALQSMASVLMRDLG